MKKATKTYGERVAAKMMHLNERRHLCVVGVSFELDDSDANNRHLLKLMRNDLAAALDKARADGVSKGKKS